MAKRERYEFSVGWLAETQFRRERGLAYPSQVSYSAATLAENEHYEQLYQERQAYMEMEQRA